MLRRRDKARENRGTIPENASSMRELELMRVVICPCPRLFKFARIERRDSSPSPFCSETFPPLARSPLHCIKLPPSARRKGSSGDAAFTVSSVLAPFALSDPDFTIPAASTTLLFTLDPRRTFKRSSTLKPVACASTTREAERPTIILLRPLFERYLVSERAVYAISLPMDCESIPDTVESFLECFNVTSVSLRNDMSFLSLAISAVTCSGFPPQY
mmetsp:Transcript_9899/g.60369  ORF Transcript_9899/g.60369 Transcript_9899/m.60369 type:complete len:216 (+) Transcript_9899:770-1417(+)